MATVYIAGAELHLTTLFLARRYTHSFVQEMLEWFNSQNISFQFKYGTIF